MDEREYLAKAREADAAADAATNWLSRRRWKKAATEYRRLAQKMAVERRLSFGAKAQKSTQQEVGDMADKITRAPKRRG